MITRSQMLLIVFTNVLGRVKTPASKQAGFHALTGKRK